MRVVHLFGFDLFDRRHIHLLLRGQRPNGHEGDQRQSQRAGTNDPGARRVLNH